MTARPAIIRASRMTVPAASEPPPVMALTTWPASTGVATPMAAASTTVTRKTEMSRRYGRANATIRRVVPRVSWCSVIRVGVADRAQHRPARPCRWTRTHRSPPGRRATSLPAGYDNPGGKRSIPDSGLTRRCRPGRAGGGSAPPARPGPARRTTRSAAPASSALISATAPRSAASTAAARSATARVELGRRARPRWPGRSGRPRPPASGGRSRRSPAPGRVRRARSRRLVPPRSGTRPRVTSAIENCASSASTRRSQLEGELESGADRVALHGGDRHDGRVGATR